MFQASCMQDQHNSDPEADKSAGENVMKENEKKKERVTKSNVIDIIKCFSKRTASPCFLELVQLCLFSL